jgi:hypothetical protein
MSFQDGWTSILEMSFQDGNGVCPLGKLGQVGARAHGLHLHTHLSQEGRGQADVMIRRDGCVKIWSET